MNHFPFFSQLDAGIINAIQNLDKTKFSGAMPYVYFAHYLGLGQTIGQTINWDYKSGGERFPPVITNLEVKPNGSMGVVRHGIVTVKFASMNQLQQYQNFFRIGNAKSIVWGWNKNRITGDNQQPANTRASEGLANNIDAWLNFCAGTSHTSDAMVGPLIDFSFTLNTDASVDATFTVGTKTEIPAYLGMNNHGTKQTPASSQNNKIDTKLARLLEPDNANFKAKLNDIKGHLLNYEFVKSKQGANELPTKIGDLAAEYLTTGYVPTERVYVDMATLIKYTVNKQKTKGAIVDISQSIAKAHPNMISTSENIIFPNSKMANPIRTGGKDDAYLILSTNPVQAFKVHERQFVNHLKPAERKFGEYTSVFEAGTYGNVEEIYVDVDFALDAWYNTGEGSVKDFIDKLCTEINIASAGLMELGLDESADSNTKNSILTIIDYNLVPKESPSITPIDLFGNDSSIINMSFNSDLPKEIISMAMLGNRKNIEIGRNLFFEYKKDFLSDEIPTGAPYLLTKPTDAEKKGFSEIPGTIRPDGTIVPLPPATDTQKKAAAELAKKQIKDAQDADYWNKINTRQIQADGVRKGMELASFQAATQGLVDENCIVIADGFPNEHGNSPDKTATKAVLKDVALVKNLYFGESGVNKNNPLLPAELELTVLGISGVTVGRIVRIKDLPFQNINDGLMQVIEVNHRVSDSTWETTIKLKYRPAN
jgi:hypothetical protein